MAPHRTKKPEDAQVGRVKGIEVSLYPHPLLFCLLSSIASVSIYLEKKNLFSRETKEADFLTRSLVAWHMKTRYIL